MTKSQTKTMVMIPYVRGVSEAVHRVFSKSKVVAVAIKPHKTLKKLPVHLQDKWSPQDTVGVVYSIHTM